MPNYSDRVYVNGRWLEGLDLGVERKLAGIDYAAASYDAVFAVRDAMKNPIARDALKEALPGI